MKNEQRREAKRQMMALMQVGRPWQEAASIAGAHISRSTAYRWFQTFRLRGDAALHDGRHGHHAKVREPVLQWLKAECATTPQVPSSLLQQKLHEHLGVQISITHLNRIRAAHGLTRQAVEAEKKSRP
jgi:transposase